MSPPPVSIYTLTNDTSRTGAAVSKALFDLLGTASYTPKEVYDVAKAVSDLSVILDDLTILWDGVKPGQRTRTKKKKTLQRRKLERQTASVVKCIDMLHGEIRALIDPRNAAARLLWAVRRSRWRKLLQQVESYKIGICTIDDIVDLAFTLKELAEKRTSKREDTVAIRWLQTENTITTCHQYIKVTMADSDQKRHQTGETVNEEIDSDLGDVSDHESAANGHSLEEDPARWLYELIFSSLEEKHSQNEQGESARGHEGEKDIKTDGANIQDTQEQNQRLHSFAQRQPNARDVVNKLLSKWTTVPKRVINGSALATLTDDSSDYDGSDCSSSGSSSIVSVGGLGNPNDSPNDISFIDVRGRKYRVPWDVARTWLGMEGFIYQAFCHVQGLWPHVFNDRYDLVRRDNTILTPHVYERIIKPGDFLCMRMWPLDPSLQPLPMMNPPGVRPGGMPMGPRPPGAPPVPPPPARGRTQRAPNSSRPVYVGN